MCTNELIKNMLGSLGRRFEILELNSNSHEDFEVILRTELPSHKDGHSAQCDGWVKAFSDATKSGWIVSCTWPRAKRFRYRKMYLCQHSSRGNSKSSSLSTSPQSRDGHCKASMSIKIKGNTVNTRKKDPLMKKGLDTEIKISFKHTHPINVATAYSSLLMSDETKIKFIQYFNEGMTPAAAKQYHEMKLISDSTGNTNIEELLSNTKHNPRNRQIYHLFHHWRTNHRHFVDVQNIKQETLNEMDIMPQESILPEDASDLIIDTEKIDQSLLVSKADGTNTDGIDTQYDKSTEAEELQVLPNIDTKTEQDMITSKNEISACNLKDVESSPEKLLDIGNIPEDNLPRKRRKITKPVQENVKETTEATQDMLYIVSNVESEIEDVRDTHPENCLHDIEHVIFKEEKIPDYDNIQEDLDTLHNKDTEDVVRIEDLSHLEHFKDKTSEPAHKALSIGFVSNIQNNSKDCIQVDDSNISDIMCLQSVQQNIMSLLPSGMSILLNSQPQTWQNLEASCSVSQISIQPEPTSEKDQKLSKLWNNFSKITSLVEENYPLLSNLTSKLIDRLEIVESAAQLVVLFSDMVASIPPKHMCPALVTGEAPLPQSRKRKKQK